MSGGRVSGLQCSFRSSPVVQLALDRFEALDDIRLTGEKRSVVVPQRCNVLTHDCDRGLTSRHVGLRTCHVGLRACHVGVSACNIRPAASAVLDRLAHRFRQVIVVGEYRSCITITSERF